MIKKIFSKQAENGVNDNPSAQGMDANEVSGIGPRQGQGTKASSFRLLLSATSPVLAAAASALSPLQH